MELSYSKENEIVKFNKIIGILGLFMVFNNMLIFRINMVSFIFIFIVYKYRTIDKFLDLNKKIHFWVLLFLNGVIISILDGNSQTNDSFARGMAVLPNYTLWCILILYISNSTYKIDFLNLSKNILRGLLLLILFYSLNLDLPFFKNNSPNSYAFILVCFSAIAITYIKITYSRFYAFLALSVILLSMLNLERRAGFILVLFSSFFAIYTDKIKFSQMISFALILLLFMLLFQLDLVKNSLNNASPRIYELIYENDDLARTDDSYLVRRAQVEKGLILFQDNPLTGIGVNNYSNYDVKFVGDFEGSELVIDKEELSSKSAHNSYIHFLAEGGLLLIIPFLLILIYNIYHFFYSFNFRTKIENAYYFSFFAMTIHIYFISEILNVYAWFLISLVSGISLAYNNKIKKWN